VDAGRTSGVDGMWDDGVPGARYGAGKYGVLWERLY